MIKEFRIIENNLKQYYKCSDDLISHIRFILKKLNIDLGNVIIYDDLYKVFVIYKENVLCIRVGYASDGHLEYANYVEKLEF